MTQTKQEKLDSLTTKDLLQELKNREDAIFCGKIFLKEQIQEDVKDGSCELLLEYDTLNAEALDKYYKQHHSDTFKYVIEKANTDFYDNLRDAGIIARDNDLRRFIYKVMEFIKKENCNLHLLEYLEEELRSIGSLVCANMFTYSYNSSVIMSVYTAYTQNEINMEGVIANLCLSY